MSKNHSEQALPANAGFAFVPRILPEDAGTMSSLQLATEIAQKYPEFMESECVAYLEGGAKAALMLGLDNAMCNGFMSEWSRFDERLYVASLFTAVKKKAADFAAAVGAIDGPRIIQ